MIPWLVVVGALGAFALLGWVLLVIWAWERFEHHASNVDPADHTDHPASDDIGHRN